MVDFLFVMIELFFGYLLHLRHYKWKLVEVGIFQRRVGHFECKCQMEGGVTCQPLLESEN